MANKRITELPAATTPIAAGVKFEAVQGGVNVQVDASDLPGSGGGAVDSVNGQTGIVVLDAADIEVTPAGNISSTDVQAALEELDQAITGANVPDADASTKGIAKLYTTPEGTNTDGAVHQSGLNAVRHKSYVATTSGTDTYTATVSPAISAVNSGDRFFINFTNANTGPATLNLNGLGAIALTKNGIDAIVPNDIKAGQVSEVLYDGTRFQLLTVSVNSPTTFVTDKKRYYHGEWRVNRLINTSTGATSSDTSKDVTDFIEIDPNTSITIFTTDESLMTVYGWTYTSAFVAISEIRSNALIGTTLNTYTFTTPANAKYIQIYTRNGGTASETDIGWRAVMEIQSAANITYKTPIIPEDFSGTDRQKIQAAIDFARWTSSPVELNGLYLVDAAVIIRSNTKIILNGTVKGAVGIRDNIFRTESAEFAPTTILNRATRNFYIKAGAGGGFAGSDEDWGTYPATGVSGQSWRAIGMLLANCENYTVDGLRVKSTNLWGICNEQARFGKIINIDFDQDGRLPNQDGINVRHGSHDILIENITGTAYDDLVAITNLEHSPDLHVLGSTVYDPNVSNLDIFNVIIKNVVSRQETKFANFSPPHYGGGVLILCEDGLKIYNVTVDGVANRKAQFYIGFTSIQYWVTTQAVYGDMENINVSNVNSPIYIRRPLKNCSFTNCYPYDQTGINRSVAIPDGSQNISRKRSDSDFEWFTSLPAAFVPTDITNMGQWFDASLGAGGMSLTTNLVNQWNDMSGNGRHITATTTARPLYSNSVGTSPNGEGTVIFDGTTDALRRALITQYQGIAGMTIFMVGGRPAGVPHGGVGVFHGFDITNRTQFLNNYTDNLIYAIVAGGTGTFNVGYQTILQSTMIYDGSLTGNANRLKLKVNGKQLPLTFSGTVGATTEAHASSKFAIGAIDFASPVYVPGSCSEVIIYERTLTDNEILQVEAYLSSKWAV